MILLGAFINGITVFIAGMLGGLLKRALPEKMSQTIVQALALCVIYIGMEGCISHGNGIRYASLIAIVSLAVGTIIGEWIDLDKWINRLGEWLQSKVKTKNGETSVATGFVNATLLICVGAWAITGSMDSGLHNSHASLIAKSVIDSISCFIMASTLGIGVAFAGIFVFCYQGLLTLGASALSGVLTEPIIAAMGCVGSILILGIGLNMLGLTKIRVVNCIPAVFIAIPFGLLIQYI